MKKFLLCISMIAVVVMAGCSQSKTLDSSAEAVEKKDDKKQELVMAVGNEPETGFDPTNGWGRYGSPLFQSTLLKRDTNLNIVNDLATSYEVSIDGKVWTVHLREDVKFSDGTPLTAADVQFTYEQAANNGSVVDLNNLENVTLIDDYTVEFTLKKAQSTFVNSLIATGIVPKHAYGEDYATNPIGSGPYRLVQWDRGQQLIVETNPLYYEDQPYFKKLTFLFLNEDAAFAAAQTGEVDVVSIPAAFSKKEVPGMVLEAIPTVDNRGIAFPYQPSGEFTEEGLPIGNDVTADIAIRKAINIAVNREELVQGVLEGYGSPAYTSVDNLPWWNPDTVFEDGDLQEAKKILQDSGWEDLDGDGILEKNSLKAEFTLLYPANDIIRQSLSLIVADMMKPLGIHILIEGKSWEMIEKEMYSNAVLMGWGSHDPHELYNIYSGHNAGIDYYNTGFYKNEIVDTYLEEALSADNEQDAIELWRNAQWDGTTGLSVQGDAPWAWLVNIDHLYLVKEGLDIGKQKIQPHEHGWPITDNLIEWKWTE